MLTTNCDLAAKRFSAEMAIGDTVFLWRAKGISCIPGIIAKGTLVSLPKNQKKFVEDYWIRRKDFKEGLRARIKLVFSVTDSFFALHCLPMI